MYSDRERQRLNDVIVNADAIYDYVGDMSFDAFVADRKTVDAAERCLQRITEAIIRIGGDRMSDIAPEIPAAAIRGFGNMLRHEYDTIDLRSVFNTIKDDLPILYAVCQRALDQSQ